MNEANNLSFPVAANSANKFVHAVLSGLGEMYKEYGEQVEISKALLENTGGVAKTEMAAKIESFLADPLEQLNVHVSTVKEIVFCLVNEVVKVFFNRYKEIIDTAFRTKTEIKNSIHYSIFLKEKTPENQNVILAFLDAYEMNDFSNEFPVYFQFMPDELKNVIEREETLI